MSGRKAFVDPGRVGEVDEKEGKPGRPPGGSGTLGEALPCKQLCRLSLLGDGTCLLGERGRVLSHGGATPQKVQVRGNRALHSTANGTSTHLPPHPQPRFSREGIKETLLHPAPRTPVSLIDQPPRSSRQASPSNALGVPRAEAVWKGNADSKEQAPVTSGSDTCLFISSLALGGLPHPINLTRSPSPTYPACSQLKHNRGVGWRMDNPPARIYIKFPASVANAAYLSARREPSTPARPCPSPPTSHPGE